MRSHHHVSLRHEERKPRGAQFAVIETPEGPLHVVHWHLGLAERERRWQVRHVLDHALFREGAGLPTLLIGDSNDWRNRLQSGVLASHGFHQVTTPISRFRSFPSYLAMGSLDKAFIRGEIAIRQARIVRSRLARIASDHLPLVLDFHLNGPHHPRPQNGALKDEL